MFSKHKPVVLVVGAGPVGLMAALTLARRGIEVEIVDKEWRPAAHSYALALHAQSLALLDQLGVLKPILEKAYPVRTVGLYDLEARRTEIRLTDESNENAFVAVMRQDVLESELERALKKLGVRVRWNHQVSNITMESDRVELTVEHLEKESMGYAVAHTDWVVASTEHMKVPFVIGADGHRSDVRRALQIEYDQIGEAQTFAVFEFKSDADPAHELSVVLDHLTTNVLWPLPDNYCRWSFELPGFTAPVGTRSKDNLLVELGATRFPVLAEDNLRALLAERAPWFKGSVDQIQWRLAVRFERRLASAFGKNRMWLAGDAAHMTGPVGIQSMNVGLREAYELGTSMADILEGSRSPDALRAFNVERMAEWRFLLGLEGGLRALAGADPWIGRWTERLVSCIPASGADLAGLVRQIGLEVEAVRSPA